ncbi:TonB-dependent siderophore receptor [Thauera linaloolentis]|uniref:TonB-dependent siderophore receptor n=1 Tax=Thauera linaloolentis (strain DSM 12138 / JCM 21573 / CCUG 41526 / CIP 105981 / IAM 15112 / NBRC 102519 / 47Lol) TaxID=1123367 RepID=N6YVN8_THAL4|nr:TonB-dependent siderophore receptor [Thauera linaloolentis]ENO86467.1 TonB-dependent siderophore receptor [Thauera linaloolentis 47Lol = DSM 12138]MCM8567346.1 TonB-dependent siderophore receptor [Thauera linaloolentis]
MPHNRPFPVRTPLASAIRLMLCGALLAGGAIQAPARAQLAEPAGSAPASAGRAYDIAAGSLDQVLGRFGREAGVMIAIDPELTQDVRSAGLRGTHTTASGLAAILAVHRLEAVPGANGGYRLRRLPPAADTRLAPVTVTAQAERGGTTEGTGSYTTGSMNTATKMPLSIRETPQSVTVMTAQRIEDQGLTSLSDVVQATPGLTVTKWGGERYRFTSRGFQVNNLMVDGLPIQYEEAALSTGAMSMYDRVEVMRGAAGLMEGEGTPGGSINLMRKRPTREFQGSLTGSVGSWDNYLGSLDVGGPINEAGTLRGRAVVSHQDKKSFIDDYENKRTLVYGILEADLTPATTATLGFSYSNEDNPGVDWNGIGTWPDGSFLPISRSTRMSPSWAYWDKKSTTVFADVEHRFDNGWKAKLAATSIDSEMDMMGTYLANQTAAPSYNLVGGSPAYRYARDQYSIDAHAAGPVRLWGGTHELVFGASHRKNKWKDEGAPTDFTPVSFNPLDWSPRSVPKPTITGSWNLWTRDAEREQTGIYGSGRFKLSDPLTLIAGARVDWYKQTIAQQWGGSAYGASDFKVDHEFTPYLGAVYDLNVQHSIYASWTRIFNPQDYYTADGGLLDPQTGSNYEVGIKGEYFGGRLNASAAIFQIDLENLPDGLPVSQCATGLTSCYRSAGEVRSRGVEFELNGELAPGWQMATSYTYASAKRLSEASAYDPIGSYSIGKRYATNIPRHLFKLATSYRLPGELSRWKVGGSLHVQDGVKSPWGVKQGGYAIAGMHASYAVTRQLDLSLNVNNLFDRKYYSTIGSYSDANFFGDPRNFLLTAKYRF